MSLCRNLSIGKDGYLKMIYFHIGARKTGSTYLQNQIFPKLDLIYLGKTSKNYPEDLIDIFYLDDIAFHKKLEHLKKWVNGDNSSQLDRLISSEAVTNTGQIFQNLGRIAKLAPLEQVSIIYFHRDEAECLRSHYLYDVRFGDTIEYYSNYFDNTDRPLTIGKRKAINLFEMSEQYIESVCEYHKIHLIKVSYQNFFSGNLSSEPPDIIRKIFNIHVHGSNVMENKSISLKEAEIYFLRNIEKRLKISLNDQQKNKLLDEFNRQLS
jgi:hypothetical protein